MLMLMPHSPIESFVGGNDDKFPTLLIKLVRYALLVAAAVVLAGCLLKTEPGVMESTCCCCRWSRGRVRWKVGAQLHNECCCYWLLQLQLVGIGSQELHEGVYRSVVFWSTSQEPYMQDQPTEANVNGKFKASLRCYMTPILQNGSRWFPQPGSYDDFRMKE